MRMTPEQFLEMTPREFSNAVSGYIEEAESRSREAWEQARMIAYYAVAPHVKKGKKMTALIPLPWDKPEFQANPFGPSRKPTPEEMEHMKRQILKSLPGWQGKQSGVS